MIDKYNIWKLIIENFDFEKTETEGSPNKKTEADNLVFYDNPYTVVLNNLKKLKKSIPHWGKLLGFETHDVYLSSGRSIRFPYLSFSYQKENLIIDFHITCPPTEARKGKGLNTIGGYYIIMTLIDTNRFDKRSNDYNDEDNDSESVVLAKKIIDLVTPEKLNTSWLEEKINELMEETNHGTEETRFPSEKEQKKGNDWYKNNDTF